MDRGEWKELTVSFIRKFRWAAAVLLTGLFLLAIPEGTSAPPPELPEESGQEASMQQELEALLSQLEGAGQVKVLLTEDTGAQTHYQTDEDGHTTSDSGEKRSETVIITSSDRDERGLIRRIDPPTYLGAVVLCQGADSARVRLGVVDAVATATGLTSDRISVLKMK